MKRLFNVTIVIFCIMGLLCSCSAGDVSAVNKVIGSSDIYTNNEINSAMKVVLNRFARDFDGCTMLEIEYNEAYSLKYSQKEAENYGADEAIILTASFDVDASGGDGSLEPNSRYNGFQWILTRNGFGGWKLRDWGYA